MPEESLRNSIDEIIRKKPKLFHKIHAKKKQHVYQSQALCCANSLFLVFIDLIGEEQSVSVTSQAFLTLE